MGQVLDLGAVEVVGDGSLETIVALIRHHPMLKTLQIMAWVVGGRLVSGQVLPSVDWRLTIGIIGGGMSQRHIGINGTRFLLKIQDRAYSGPVDSRRNSMIMIMILDK